MSVLRGYHNLYTALHFERLGLFRLLAKTYSTETVLYPGSNIHIAPSFFFPLALNASGVAPSCKHYLKANGYFLTNNFQDEAAGTVRETDFNLAAMIKGKGERYKLILQSDSSMISDTLSKPFPR
jgi:hypothetical protein